MMVPMALHDQKSHVGCHFDHLDLTNEFYPHHVLASHDHKGNVRHNTNHLKLTKNGATDSAINVILFWYLCQKHHTTKQSHVTLCFNWLHLYEQNGALDDAIRIT